jgi:predicted flap endonuclease-1-like 5' DNA nuclease
MFSWLRSAAKPAQAPKTARHEPEPRPSQAELEAKRRALGVEDALKEIPGVTAPMLVALGENGIKTLEELAGCAVDDLHGWIEPMGDTSTAHAGRARWVRAVPRRMRGHDHQGAGQGRLDRRSRGATDETIELTRRRCCARFPSNRDAAGVCLFIRPECRWPLRREPVRTRDHGEPRAAPIAHTRSRPGTCRGGSFSFIPGAALRGG